MSLPCAASVLAALYGGAGCCLTPACSSVKWEMMRHAEEACVKAGSRSAESITALRSFGGVGGSLLSLVGFKAQAQPTAWVWSLLALLAPVRSLRDASQ